MIKKLNEIIDDYIPMIVVLFFISMLVLAYTAFKQTEISQSKYYNIHQYYEYYPELPVIIKNKGYLKDNIITESEYDEIEDIIEELSMKETKARLLNDT